MLCRFQPNTGWSPVPSGSHLWRIPIGRNDSTFLGRWLASPVNTSIDNEHFSWEFTWSACIMFELCLMLSYVTQCLSRLIFCDIILVPNSFQHTKTCELGFQGSTSSQDDIWLPKDELLSCEHFMYTYMSLSLLFSQLDLKISRIQCKPNKTCKISL